MTTGEKLCPPGGTCCEDSRVEVMAGVGWVVVAVTTVDEVAGCKGQVEATKRKT